MSQNGGWTPRERQIMALVKDGLSYKAIARKLGLERGTVSCYISRIGRMIPGEESPLRKILAL